MKLLRYVLILSISIGMCGILEAEEGRANNDAIGLERIVVTNRRAFSAISEATENIMVVNKEEIEKLPVKNFGEVLSYTPGVDIEPRQGSGRGTEMTLQGADSRQIRVMIDGIPMNTQSSGQVNPYEFPIENIERIEIVKGAASSIWGSGLGGVINIVTKDTGTTLIPKGNITTSFSEFRTRKNSFDLSGAAGEMGYYLTSSYMESGGKGTKDDVLEKKAFGKLSYDLKDLGKITSSFGYSGADVNSGIFPDGTWQAQPYKDRYGKIGWEKSFGLNDVKIDFKHFRKDTILKYFLTVDDEVPFLEVKNKDVLYQLSINSSFRLRKKDLLVLGVDLDYDALKSPSYLTKAKSVKLYAPYANYTFKIEPWDFNFGLRYDHNSEFGEQTSPSIGAVYHFKNIAETLFRAVVSRAFNAPPLLWKYNYSDNFMSMTAPNPDLKPERAWVFETGFESQIMSAYWFKLSLYRADVSNAIAAVMNAQNFWYQENFKKHRRQGAEFQNKLKIFEGLNFAAAAAFNDIEDRTTRRTVRGGGKARQSFDVGLEYKNKRGLVVSLIGYYNRWNKQTLVYYNQLGEEVSVNPNDRKMLCDLKVSQGYKNLTLFLNVYNLANSKYWADYYFPLRERYFEGGVNFKW